MKYLVVCTCFMLLLACVAATDPMGRSVLAEEFPSGIAGRVTRHDGAVIVGASVRIIARSTKKVYSHQTDANGEYIVDLEPGVYDVEAEAVGFKKAKRKSIPVMRGGRLFVDFVMQLGKDPRHP